MLKLANDSYDHLKPYVPGKPISETQRELGLERCIKLASNENPLGPSPKALAAATRALQHINDYPDGGAYALKQGLSRFLDVSSDMLIVGNGTNELIEMLIRTFIRPDENLLYIQGTFIAYRLCAEAAGVAIKDVGNDLDAIIAAIDEKTKMVFIGNPNNPTGSYINKKDLEYFLGKVPCDVIVVLDEAYFEYATAPDYPNGLAFLSSHDRLVVTRTFSKCYGLAGLRVGYAVAQPELIDYLNRGRQPFNVSSIAQEAALAALDDQEHVKRSVAMNAQEMQRVVPALESRGLKVTPSQGNFVLVDFHQPAHDVFQKLLHQGVIVRPMAGYGFATSQRITLGTPEQNDMLLHAIDTVS